MAEGWGYSPTSSKKHYFTPKNEGFVSAESICKKWTIRYDDYAGLGLLKQGNAEDERNCAICKRKLLKERAKNEK